MRNKIITAALTIAFIFTSFSLFAQEKAAAAKTNEKVVAGMHMKQGMMRGRLNMLKGLNLTDEQKQKMQQLNLDQQKEMIKIQSEIQLKRVEIKELFAEKQVNTAKLSTLTEAIGKLELQIKKLKTENWIKVNSFLKDDQKEIWKKHFAREGFMRQGARIGKGMMQGHMGQRGQAMMQGHMGQRGQAMMQGRRMGQRAHAMMQGRPMGQRGPGIVQGRMGRDTMIGRDQAMGNMQGKMDQNKKEEVTTEKK